MEQCRSGPEIWGISTYQDIVAVDMFKLSYRCIGEILHVRRKRGKVERGRKEKLLKAITAGN